MSPLLGHTDHAARTLPIATKTTVRAHTKVLLRDHRGPLARVLGWHVVAALVALVGPWVIGQVVQEVTTGDGSLTRIDQLIALLVAAIVVQTVLTWVARRASFVLSEKIFARLREDFIGSSVRLPLSVVERAGTGDLVARTTNDVESLAHIIRFGIPAIVVATTTVVATAVAAFLTSPLAALSLLTAALVPQAGRRRLPVGARLLRPAQRRGVGDGRGRPDDGRPRAAGGTGPALPGLAGRVRRRRGLHAQPAAALVPLARDRLLPADRDGGALGRVARLERPHHHRRGHR